MAACPQPATRPFAIPTATTPSSLAIQPCFPEGPEGAHKLSNRSGATVRFVIFSTRGDPAIAFYPDSGKIGVWPPGKFFRESDAVEYFHGDR